MKKTVPNNPGMNKNINEGTRIKIISRHENRLVIFFTISHRDSLSSETLNLFIKFDIYNFDIINNTINEIISATIIIE